MMWHSCHERAPGQISFMHGIEHPTAASLAQDTCRFGSKKFKKVIKACDIISIVVVAYPQFKFIGIRRALWNVVHAGFGGSAKRLTLQIMPAKRWAEGTMLGA